MLAHRLTLSGISSTGEDLRILERIIESIPVPLEET